jgi:hypothetical protein
MAQMANNIKNKYTDGLSDIIKYRDSASLWLGEILKNGEDFD